MKLIEMGRSPGFSGVLPARFRGYLGDIRIAHFKWGMTDQATKVWSEAVGGMSGAHEQRLSDHGRYKWLFITATKRHSL